MRAELSQLKPEPLAERGTPRCVSGSRRFPQPESKSIYCRLDVLMEHDLQYPAGVAATEWANPVSHPEFSEADLRSITAVSLYARTLVNHTETTAELLRRVTGASAALARGVETFDLAPWDITVGGRRFAIWPWVRGVASEMSGAKHYVSILSAARGGFAFNLNMAFGLERVLAPSAPLLALEFLARSLVHADRLFLAELLQRVNEYYAAAGAAALGSDRTALAFALSSRSVVG